MIEGIVVCEGNYRKTLKFNNWQHYLDFFDGFLCGASQYGAGSCYIYSIDDLELVEENIKKLIIQHLVNKNNQAY